MFNRKTATERYKGLKEIGLTDVFELYAHRTDMEILTNTDGTILLSQMLQIYKEKYGRYGADLSTTHSVTYS